MSWELAPQLLLALAASLGMSLLTAGVLHWRQRRRISGRLAVMASGWAAEEAAAPGAEGGRPLHPHLFASRLGAQVADRMPGQVALLTARMDRAGLSGDASAVDLLGWKAVGLCLGLLLGAGSVVCFGATGVLLLGLTTATGWYAIDGWLGRRHASRRREILRNLPTVMDLLVLSMEAGMGLDLALRTLVREYRSPLSNEIGRVLHDVDFGISRGQAFERMAERVGLDELRGVSRAIVQSEELGASLVTVMQTQSHDVRVARRRAAEAEALRAPIKMLIPLVIFILPTLFMLLLGPVMLRTGAALAGNVP